MHKDLGQCGGGHVDVAPYDIDPLIAEAQGPTCDAKCARTRSLRTRHTDVHRKIRAAHCGPASKTKSVRCKAYYATNSALHRVATREHIKL
jgi:hypothetical protein